MPCPATDAFAADAGLFVAVNKPIFLFRAAALCMSASIGRTGDSMASCVLRRFFVGGSGFVIALCMLLCV